MEKVTICKWGSFGLRLPSPFGNFRKVLVGLEGTEPTEQAKQVVRDYNNRVKARTDLEKSSRELCRLLEDQLFIIASISYLTFLISGNIPLRPPTSVDDLQYGEEIYPQTNDEEQRNTAARKKDVMLSRSNLMCALHGLASALLYRPIDAQYEELDTPELLFRAFKSNSHTHHSKELGFRCSDQVLTPPDYEAKTLQYSSMINLETFRDHCENTVKPSSLIAMSDSPIRILNITRTWDFKHMEGDIIAVINTTKLLGTGVLFNRTTTLAKHFGVQLRTATNPGGLHYANPNYWVAYRWIPAECIERYVSISTLRGLCEKKGIGKHAGI